MQKPSKADTLSFYLSISLVVVSSVLVKAIAKGQIPVYYVSKVLALQRLNDLSESCEVPLCVGDFS